MGFKKRESAPAAARVGAYVRVSSRAQNYATQRATIAQAAAARGDTIAEWYAEKRTGKELARPELNRVRADACAGHLRRLYLFKLDRLTRSGIRDTLEVIDELRRHGCEPVTVADGFDLAGPAAEIVLAVMAWASKVERQAINERIAAARDRLEAAGEHWGRPPRMDPMEIQRARSLRGQGRTVRQIATALGVPKSTVQRALSQKVVAKQPPPTG